MSCVHILYAGRLLSLLAVARGHVYAITVIAEAMCERLFYAHMHSNTHTHTLTLPCRLQNRTRALDFNDTFLSFDHVKAAFPQYTVKASTANIYCMQYILHMCVCLSL